MSKKTPKQRQAETTQGRILDVALRCFAEGGYAGTTMRDIADACGVSQALIHHHFDTKRRLYRLVKERAYQRYVERHREDLQSAPKDADALARSVRALFERMHDEQDVLRLHTWSLLEAPVSAADTERELMKLGGSQLGAAQDAGLIRDGLDANLLMVAGVGMAGWWLQNRRRLHAMFYADAELEALDGRFIDLAVDLFLNGAATEAAQDDIDDGASEASSG